MKNITQSDLLNYSVDQLYDVIDDYNVYDISTVLNVFGICYVDKIPINKDRIKFLNMRIGETGFKSFQEYVNDLVNKKGVKDIGEYLDLVPEGYKEEEDSSDEYLTKKNNVETKQPIQYPTINLMKIVIRIIVFLIIYFLLYYLFNVESQSLTIIIVAGTFYLSKPVTNWIIKEFFSS